MDGVTGGEDGGVEGGVRVEDGAEDDEASVALEEDAGGAKNCGNTGMPSDCNVS